MQTKHHMTKLIKLSSKFPLWKTLKGSEIRSHYSNKYSEMLQDKWMYEIKKIDLRKKIVLAEYFEQQTDCSRYRRKISQSRRSPSWRNQLYLPFLTKQMETMPQSHKQSAM